MSLKLCSTRTKTSLFDGLLPLEASEMCTDRLSLCLCDRYKGRGDVSLDNENGGRGSVTGSADRWTETSIIGQTT